MKTFTGPDKKKVDRTRLEGLPEVRAGWLEFRVQAQTEETSGTVGLRNPLAYSMPC
jgi:hypothetical protein